MHLTARDNGPFDSGDSLGGGLAIVGGGTRITSEFSRIEGNKVGGDGTFESEGGGLYVEGAGASYYGFLDAINPSFTFDDVKLLHGRLVEGVGWVDNDYLGIDQGPIVAMIENYRSGLVWNLMQRNPHIRKGLQRAGFSGGWLDRPSPATPAKTAE